MTNILVLGAGELGLAILQALSAHPSRPTVFVLIRSDSSTRRADLLTDLAPLGVRIVTGDLTSPLPTLVPLLRGYDVVISATGFGAGPGISTHIANAALEARVPWFFPWQFGVDYDVIGPGSSQPLFDEQIVIRDQLRAQTATKWTVISTGLFTSFLFEPAFGVYTPDGKGGVTVTALGKWENKITTTSARDIGRCTADVILSGEVVDSGLVYIAGDTVTFGDVAKLLEKRGWKVNKAVRTVEELQREREEHPDDLGPKYQLIWARNRGVSWEMDKTWNKKRGIKMETVEDWIKARLPSP